MTIQFKRTAGVPHMPDSAIPFDERRYQNDLNRWFHEIQYQVLSVQNAINSTGLTLKDEGSTVGTAGGITSINIVGGTVVATGSGAAGTITITGLTVKDEGVAQGTSGGITSIDFTGAGVSASASGGAATVNIAGGGSGAFDYGKAIHTNRATFL